VVLLVPLDAVRGGTLALAPLSGSSPASSAPCNRCDGFAHSCSSAADVSNDEPVAVGAAAIPLASVVGTPSNGPAAADRDTEADDDDNDGFGGGAVEVVAVPALVGADVKSWPR